jgi:hypothetical protein
MVRERPAMPTNRRPSPAEERAALEARRLQSAELFTQGRALQPGHPRRYSRQALRSLRCW